MKKFKIYRVFIPLILIIFIQCDENDIEDTAPVRVFSPGMPILVGPEGFDSTFSYYNTSPESPNGTMLTYVKINDEQTSRYQRLTGELWVCDVSLLSHEKIADLADFDSHNGVNAQWIDNTRIVYRDEGNVKIVNLLGESVIPPFQVFSLGHEPYENKFLYSKISEDTNLYSIYEYNTITNQHRFIADAAAFNEAVTIFSFPELRPVWDRRIRHLKYSPDGTKIAFRIDFGDGGEEDNHLVTMKLDGSDIQYFGPKPMHFAWYDNNSIMGHDNQIDDDRPNDKSTRRWSLQGEFIETIAGLGNHLSASTDRSTFATESWYNENPVILRAYKRGQTNAFWQETVSSDDFSVWDLGNHINPAFSRDGKRLYYRKNSAAGQSQAYMVVLPDN
jgi:hypothetical protein